MAFVSETTKNVLSRAKFSKERTNIENSHPVMDQDLPRLLNMAKVVGIDFDKTEYSYQVVKKEGDLNVSHIPHPIAAKIYKRSQVVH